MRRATRTPHWSCNSWEITWYVKTFSPRIIISSPITNKMYHLDPLDFIRGRASCSRVRCRTWWGQGSRGRCTSWGKGRCWIENHRIWRWCLVEWAYKRWRLRLGFACFGGRDEQRANFIKSFWGVSLATCLPLDSLMHQTILYFLFHTSFRYSANVSIAQHLFSFFHFFVEDHFHMSFPGCW